MTKSISPTRDFLRRLNRNRLTTVGLVLLSLILLVCLITPFLPLADPDATLLENRLQPPFDGDSWLGTDQLGRDLLSRLLWGTRVSIAVGLVATMVAALIGSIIGLLSGYFSGVIDTLLMRVVDTLMAFPYLLLALAIVAAFGPGLMNALFAIAIVNIPFFARTVRGATLTLVHKEFILAARTGGASHFEILRRELLPNVLPVIVVTISTTSGWMILETAGLSFLGLGAQPPTADLGSMLGEGRKLLFTAPYVSVLPGVVILVLVVSLNLLGDGIRDVLDPRLRGGAMRSPMPSTEHIAGPAQKQAMGNRKLRVADLSVSLKKEGGHEALVRNINLELNPGECLGIVGESGCGKSVTALSLTALAPSPPLVIDGGSVFLEDKDLLALPLPQLQDIRGDRIAYVFQDPLATLNPVMTVGVQISQMIRRHQSLSAKDTKAKVIELLKTVHIPKAEQRYNSYPHQMSGGMRQRVCIAMALANQPEILVADEPTTALDVTIQAEILALLDELRRKFSLSVIFITHDLGVVSALCDRVAVMYAGQVVELGKTKEVLAEPHHPYTKALLACTPVLREPKKLGGGIPGLPPLPGEFPLGCGFEPRCPLAKEDCRKSMPQLIDRGGRGIRCILSAEEVSHG